MNKKWFYFQKNRTFGILSVVLMTVLTVILILIPRKSDIISDMTEADRREPDLMTFYRPLILFLNITALLFALFIIYKKFVCKMITRFENPFLNS